MLLAHHVNSCFIVFHTLPGVTHVLTPLRKLEHDTCVVVPKPCIGSLSDTHIVSLSARQMCTRIVILDSLTKSRSHDATKPVTTCRLALA